MHYRQNMWHTENTIQSRISATWPPKRADSPAFNLHWPEDLGVQPGALHLYLERQKLCDLRLPLFC